nr:PEGA domain-containing protein [Kofleriaceae bacterium]
AGFVDYLDTLNVPAGAVIRIAPTLAIAPAILDVSSEPIGASVTLSGRAIGVTPLKLTDVAPANDVVLVIAKAGYTSYESKISLQAGEPTVIKQSLKAAQRFGLVNISVQDGHGGVSAGNVYLAGKFLAEAPVQGLRLPVGRHQLVLKNTTRGLTKNVTVVVDEKKVNFYLVKYDGA